MSHDHAHNDASELSERRLWWALNVLGIFMIIEVAVGFQSRSLALISDAGHLLSDLGAFGGAIVAARLARRPAEGPWTFGWRRAEVLSAAFSGAALVLVSIGVLADAVVRLVNPSRVDAREVLVVALVGVVVNLVMTVILGPVAHASLNVRGVVAHVVTDLYDFAVTALAAVVIILTHFERADAIASLLVVAIVWRTAIPLLRTSLRVLLEAAPSSMDLEELKKHLRGVAHVRDVHDVHVWDVSDGLPILSAHVVVDDQCFLDGHAPQMLDEVQSCVADHFDVEHSTFQFEPVSHLGHEIGGHE